LVNILQFSFLLLFHCHIFLSMMCQKICFQYRERERERGACTSLSLYTGNIFWHIIERNIWQWKSKRKGKKTHARARSLSLYSPSKSWHLLTQQHRTSPSAILLWQPQNLQWQIFKVFHRSSMTMLCQSILQKSHILFHSCPPKFITHIQF